MDAGLIPVKRLDGAKRRLAPALDSRQRRALAEALLEDALELCATVDFLDWWMVSDDREVLERAARSGLSVVNDLDGDLNRALERAIEAIGARRSVTIVPCDVPLARRSDLEDLIDTGATSDVVLVPSAGDGGTNGLYLSPPSVLAPRYGPASMAAHLSAAHSQKLRVSVLDLPSLAKDIDSLDDLEEFMKDERASDTAAGRLLTSLARH